MRAAVYTRISDDRRGEELGVERQRQDCYKLAEAEGLTVVALFVDNSRSAYSGKPRPGYQRLLEAIKAGLIDVVLSWDPDRLHRSPAELEHFIALMERHGVGVQTVNAGHWDLSTPSGRLVARQLGAVAKYESEHKAERVRRALEQNAAAGRTHGRPTYGWTRVYDLENGRGRDVVNPAEAAVIRSIADRLIGGDSLRQITADLNSAGTPSPRGGPWAKGMVRALAIRERNAGNRVYRGDVIGKGDWEPILTDHLFEQVKAVLSDPARRTTTGTAAKHLLSGIARCGVCGAVMRSAMNRSVAAYRCSEKSCVARNRRDVDALVTAVVLERLSRPDAADLLNPSRGADQKRAVANAAELQQRLDRAADDYADGKIDSRQLERITARLRPQIDAAEAQARIVDDSPVLAGLAGNAKAAEVWETLTLTRRRAVVAATVNIMIHRARQGARVFDRSSVEITPK